jgi:hypothetical protein
VFIEVDLGVPKYSGRFLRVRAQYIQLHSQCALVARVPDVEREESFRMRHDNFDEPCYEKEGFQRDSRPGVGSPQSNNYDLLALRPRDHFSVLEKFQCTFRHNPLS